jgi:hypothetical protein
MIDRMRNAGRNLSGRRLGIAVAGWAGVVAVGGYLAWYGFAGGDGVTPPDGDGTQVVAATATSTGAATDLPPTPTSPLDTSTPTSPSGSDEPTPTATPEPTPTPAVEEAFGYGIAINGTGGDVSYMMTQVDEQLGLGWIKQQVQWDFFEGIQGQMDWSGYDWIVYEANQRGLKVLLSVVGAPEWAISYRDDDPDNAPPDDLELYADFLARLLDRYEGQVQAIEVWNEQNIHREWDTAEGVSATEYVELLRLAYETIKARDPSILVISGALSPTGNDAVEASGRVLSMDDFSYFDRMIQAGALDYCDCIGAHANGYNMPPGVRWDEGYDDPTADFRGPFDNPHHSWSFDSTIWGYRDRVVAAGYDTPICLTEFGWASSEGLEGCCHEQFYFAYDNTAEEQALWDVQAFQLMRDWGFVRLGILWNLNFSQLGSGPKDPNAPYALIDFLGQARSAYSEISQMEKR